MTSTLGGDAIGLVGRRSTPGGGGGRGRGLADVDQGVADLATSVEESLLVGSGSLVLLGDGAFDARRSATEIKYGITEIDAERVGRGRTVKQGVELTAFGPDRAGQREVRETRGLDEANTRVRGDEHLLRGNDVGTTGQKIGGQARCHGSRKAEALLTAHGDGQCRLACQGAEQVLRGGPRAAGVGQRGHRRRASDFGLGDFVGARRPHGRTLGDDSRLVVTGGGDFLCRQRLRIGRTQSGVGTHDRGPDRKFNHAPRFASA